MSSQNNSIHAYAHQLKRASQRERAKRINTNPNHIQEKRVNRTTIEGKPCEAAQMVRIFHRLNRDGELKSGRRKHTHTARDRESISERSNGKSHDKSLNMVVNLTVLQPFKERNGENIYSRITKRNATERDPPRALTEGKQARVVSCEREREKKSEHKNHIVPLRYAVNKTTHTCKHISNGYI